MGEPPPLPPNRQKLKSADSAHFRWLAIFHFVIAGAAAIGLLFLYRYCWLVAEGYSNARLFGDAVRPPSPQEASELHQYFAHAGWRCLFSGIFLVVAGGLNFLSGIAILQRKLRSFSLVVSGFDLLLIPFGTVLGIFTLRKLLRDSARELYEAEKARG